MSEQETTLMLLDGHPESETTTPEDLIELFDEANRVPDVFRRMRESLPRLEDEQIFQVAHFSRETEQQSYLLRGACADALVGRIQARPGFKDVDGKGIRATMFRLAIEFGVDVRTLDEDRRIWKTFYEPVLVAASTSLFPLAIPEPPPGLVKGHHVAALKAADPIKALEMIKTKAANDASYTVTKAAADVSYQNAGKDPSGIHLITVELDDSEWDGLGWMVRNKKAADRRDAARICIRDYTTAKKYSRKPEDINPL